MMYPGEFHYFTRAHVLRDAWHRVDDFFAFHLQGKSKVSALTSGYLYTRAQRGHSMVVKEKQTTYALFSVLRGHAGRKTPTNHPA